MGFFHFFKKKDINEGIKQYKQTPNAILLDVRTPQEYAGGSIEGSCNLPLQEIERVSKMVPNPQTPLFVYCLSGARSRQASAKLERMGYIHVTNIGGINRYRGKVV